MGNVTIIPSAVWDGSGLGDERTLVAAFNEAVESFDSNITANGGFADATIVLSGDWRRSVPHGRYVRAHADVGVIWEGIVEDVSWDSSDRTTVLCTGHQRLFDWASGLLPYQIREFAWEQPSLGTAGAFISGAATFNYQPDYLAGYSLGGFDSTDPTRQGIRFRGHGQAYGASTGVGVTTRLPSALAEAGTVKGYTTFTGANVGSGVANMSLWVGVSSDGTTWTATQYTTTGEISVSAPAGTRHIRIGWRAGTSGVTPVAGDSIAVEFLRLVGTTVAEDDTATTNNEGFYAQTLLRDLLVRGGNLISYGIKEDLRDFTISRIGSWSRVPLRNYLEQIFLFYDGSWGVFEDRTLRYTPDLGAQIVTIDMQEVISHNLRRSMDVAAKTVYLRYTDAVTGQEAEVSANVDYDAFNLLPFPRSIVIDAPSPMTANTAARLALLASRRASQIPLYGPITVPAFSPAHTSGSANLVPLCLARPGWRVNLVNQPEFGDATPDNTHKIIETNFSLSDMTVTLTVGRYTDSLDVLMARVAAVTQAITG